MNTDKLKTMTIAEYVGLYVAGKIVRYPHNRGRNKNATIVVTSIVNDLCVPALGTIHLCDMGNGTYMLADGHSRTEGLRSAIEQGKVSHTGLNSPIHLSINPKESLLPLYSKLNVSAGHTSSNKLDNPDYAFARIINNLLSGFSDELKRRYTFRPQFANVLYSVAHSLDMDYASVFIRKNNVRSLFNVIGEKPVITLTTTQEKSIREALAYYEEFCVHLRNQFVEGRVPADGKAILKSAALFGFMLCDYLDNEKRLTACKPSTLARRIYNSLGTSTRLIKFITNGTQADIRDTVRELRRLVD